MERLESGIGKRIALLATGNELVNGEIIDTNAPTIAQSLLDQRLIPGTRIIVGDQQKEIEEALRYLLTTHAIVITIGGLGPTSDDLTRFALSAALQKPLQFHLDSWNQIVKKLSSYGLSVPENNRQQCLFPSPCEIYPNPNGTAAACCIPYGKQLIFMLPGPPNECLPLFNQHVIPRLLSIPLLQQEIYRESWMLLSVSEGNIAKQLAPLLEQYPSCEIGYRVSSPYLEVKLQSTNKKTIDTLSEKITFLLQKHLVSRNKKTASTLLAEYISSSSGTTFSILDEATKGGLATALSSPMNHRVLFLNGKKGKVNILLQGLADYWEQKQANSTHIDIHLIFNSHTEIQKRLVIPMRGIKTISYAVELVCQFLLGELK